MCFPPVLLLAISLLFGSGQQQCYYPDLSVVPDLSADPRPLVVSLAQQRVNQRGGSLTEYEMRAALELAGWEGQALEQALLVSYCESRWSPWAVGDGGKSLGLFQLWTGWFGAFGQPAEQWHDIVTNARVARYVVERRGRWGGGGGWSCASVLANEFPGVDGVR